MPELKCKTCANSVFDDIWGEYKCKITQHTIYDPDKVVDCEFYKQSTKKEITE